MNRLWVLISVVIFVVVLTMALFPVVYREIAARAGWFPKPPERPAFENQSQEEVEKFRQAIERRNWINLMRTLAVGAVAGLAAGILLTRWLVAPLRQLERGAQAVAQRQWQHRVPIQGSAEIRSVARAFNQMAVELERQEKLRRDMLADVSHELRHPVHILQGSLRAILDGVYPLDMHEIDRMLEQTQNLAGLVDDLHELALAEARELPLFKEQADLVEIAANVIEIFQPLASQQSIDLSVELPPTHLYSQVDRQRTRQALLNLLSNAVRYTPAGGQISFSLQEADHEARFTITDSGIGIPGEDLPRVFDRFYRVDSSRNRDLPGAGLGLAIAQAIIQAHGGHIDVASPGPNQGSTFTVRLPVIEETS